MQGDYTTARQTLSPIAGEMPEAADAVKQIDRMLNRSNVKQVNVKG